MPVLQNRSSGRAGYMGVRLTRIFVSPLLQNRPAIHRGQRGCHSGGVQIFVLCATQAFSLAGVFCLRSQVLPVLQNRGVRFACTAAHPHGRHPAPQPPPASAGPAPVCPGEGVQGGEGVGAGTIPNVVRGGRGVYSWSLRYTACTLGWDLSQVGISCTWGCAKGARG